MRNRACTQVLAGERPNMHWTPQAHQTHAHSAVREKLHWRHGRHKGKAGST
jgi:hypothetical protein